MGQGQLNQKEVTYPESPNQESESGFKPGSSRCFQSSRLLRLLWTRLVSSVWSDTVTCETAWHLQFLYAGSLAELFQTRVSLFEGAVERDGALSPVAVGTDRDLLVTQYFL